MPAKAKIRQVRRPSLGKAIPVSTYRLQLNSEFTFLDAIKRIPYLAKLGITHLYLSPILQAAPNSMHGYDVINHSEINTELGGMEGFKELVKVVHAHDMGIVLDIVPNHMALPTPAWLNAQLWDVLYRGHDSKYAKWFDVDWSNKHARLLMPILQTRLGDAIENNEFSIEKVDLSEWTQGVQENSQETNVLRYKDSFFPIAEGTENLPFTELLEAQHYRLAYQGVADEELNYRRFFDIGALFALRMENEEVFEATHSLIFELIDNGYVDGLRIDHIDGLSDPEEYLQRLWNRTGGIWVVVEKIIDQGKSIEPNWYCAGTTGYETINATQNVLLSSYGQDILGHMADDAANVVSYLQKQAPVRGDTHHLIEEAKRYVMDHSLWADVRRVTALADDITREDQKLHDHTWRTINICLIEILVALNQYRVYVRPGVEPSISNVQAIEEAVGIARLHLSEEQYDTLYMIKNLILGLPVGTFELQNSDLRQRFIILFQQLSVATMAKGVEDTAFYRYNILTAKSEVGANLERFSITEHAWHEFVRRRQIETPFAMNVSTTHDTKRSEDVRAQQILLSQQAWHWRNLSMQLRKEAQKYYTPQLDGSTENLIWQTVISTMVPDGPAAGPIEASRLGEYMIKAIREAKVYTSWSKPNLEYEESVLHYACSVVEDEKIVAMLNDWTHENVANIHALILAQKVLHLLCPGVADIYQGTETLSLMLVDPDNRRAVDYDIRSEMLDRMINPDFNPDLPLGDTANSHIRLDYHPTNIAEIKLLVTYVALQLRKDFTKAFVGADAGFASLPLSTDTALAFARTLNNQPQIVAIVTRNGGDLHRDGGWSEHIVTLPKPLAGFSRWCDRLTGKQYKAGSVRLAELLSTYPVALLEPVCGETTKNFVRLWAPEASEVTLYVADEGTYSSTQTAAEAVASAEYKQISMTRYSDIVDILPADEDIPQEEGWWRSDHRIKENTDYLFSVDGGMRVPDPRSACQPFGVSGFSRITDVLKHKWSDLNWSGVDHKGKVFYELHIGTFTAEGTFEAVIPKLDYLKDLGIDIIEIMPIATFDGDFGWGYDGVDQYAIYEQYGGPQKLIELVDAAHRLGIGVCIDVVYNHLGPTGNYLNETGPYYSDAYQTPWGASFNFDQEHSDGVRRWIVDHAFRLIDKFHVDALRLDAIHTIYDNSEEHILAQLSSEISARSQDLGRAVSIIAESDDNDEITLRDVSKQGRGMDGQWVDDFHHALYTYLSGEKGGYYQDFGSLDDLEKAFKHGFVYSGEYSKYRKAPHGTALPEDFDLRRLVVFFSNHDQIGNRGLGDRPSDNMSPEQCIQAAALTLLSPFSPLIFMGEEWQASTPFQFFADYTDENVMDNCRNGRTVEFESFGWQSFYNEKYGHPVTIPDPISIETYERCKLNWSEMGDEVHSLSYNWYKSLIAIRKKYLVSTPITSADVEVRTTSSDQGDTFIAYYAKGINLAVAVNFSGVTQELDIHEHIGHPEVILSSQDSPAQITHEGKLYLNPAQVAVIKF